MPWWGGGALALLSPLSRGGDVALPGRFAGCRPQSAVARGHLCWLPTPSARGEPAAVPPPGSASRGRPGGATADSLHPRVLARPPAPCGRKRRGWGAAPPQVSPRVRCCGAGGGTTFRNPSVGCRGGDRLPPGPPGWLQHHTPCCPWMSPCARDGPWLLGMSRIQTPPRAVHMVTCAWGGSHPLLPRAAPAPGCPKGSSPGTLPAAGGAGAGPARPLCWWQPPSPPPSLLSARSILRARGRGWSPPCVWSRTTAGAGHRQVHSGNPHGRCGNRCPARRGRRPLMRR